MPAVERQPHKQSCKQRGAKACRQTRNSIISRFNFNYCYIQAARTLKKYYSPIWPTAATAAVIFTEEQQSQPKIATIHWPGRCWMMMGTVAMSTRRSPQRSSNSSSSTAGINTATGCCPLPSRRSSWCSVISCCRSVSHSCSWRHRSSLPRCWQIPRIGSTARRSPAAHTPKRKPRTHFSRQLCVERWLPNCNSMWNFSS